MKEHVFAICAYKESVYLEKCIESLINQTSGSQVVIATSTPNEFIHDLANKYNIDVVVNPQGPMGIGYDFDFALLTGSKRGKYVTVAHQDDTYQKEYGENILATMTEDTIIAFSDYHEERESGIVTTNTNLKIKRILLLPLRFKIFQRSIFIRRRILGLGNPICCPAVSFNRDMVKTPIFANDFKSNVDWYAWEQLSKEKGRFVFINRDLMMHRVHEESTTTEIIRENIRGQEDLEMLSMFSPRWLAKLINKLYGNAEKCND